MNDAESNRLNEAGDQKENQGDERPFSEAGSLAENQDALTEKDVSVEERIHFASTMRLS